MLQPNQLMDKSVTVARDGFEAARKSAKMIEQHVKELPDAAVVTARALITAEERLRQRVASSLRVVVATLFLMVSGLISLGANAAVAAASAMAKKVSPQSKERIHRVKKSKHHHSVQLHSSKASHVVRGHQQGIASWYGDQFNHRRTASGVRFNKLEMMAAHRSLPFGTQVKVTNLVNHKSCVVRITDRGPFKPGRIIDLSEAAAQKLDMASIGTAQVELEVLGSETLFQDIASETFEDANFERSRPVFDHIPYLPDRALDSILFSAQEQATR